MLSIYKVVYPRIWIQIFFQVLSTENFQIFHGCSSTKHEYVKDFHDNMGKKRTQFLGVRI